MSAKEYVYLGVITLTDGSEQVLDLEEHGWAEPTRLAQTVRFALIPKPTTDPSGPSMPIVVVNIPTGAKPVFKTRRFVSNPIGVKPTPERLAAIRADVDIAVAAGDEKQIAAAKQALADAEAAARVTGVSFRCYAVGYKRGKTEVLTWVLPNGGIEVGPDPLLADLILRHLTYGLPG